MENSKILELYISKVDKDQAELKQDIRDSEKRVSEQMLESEKIVDTRLELIEKRMDTRLEHIEGMISEQNKNIISLKNEMKDRLEEDKRCRYTNIITITLGVIVTVVAMIGIYYATASTITDILGVAK